MTWVAVAIAGGAIIGGVASMSAADKQASAAKDASAQTMAQYYQTRQDLAPWVNSGQTALSSLMNLSGLQNGPLTVPGGAASTGQRPTAAQFTTYKPQITGYTPRPPESGLGQYADVYSGGKPIYSQQPVFNQTGYDAAMSRWQAAQQSAQGAPGGVNPNAPASQQLAGATQNSPLLAPFSLRDFQESPSYQFNLHEGLDAINKSAAARGNYYAPQTLQDVAKYSQGLAGNEFNNAYGMYNQNQQNVWNRLFQLQGSGQNAAAQTGAFGANATNVSGQNMIGAGNAQAAGIVGAANAINGGVGDYYNQWLTSQILGGRNQSIYNSPSMP